MCFSFSVDNARVGRPGFCAEAIFGSEYENSQETLSDMFFGNHGEPHEVRIWFLGSAEIEGGLQAFKIAEATRRAPWETLNEWEHTDIALHGSQIVFPTTEEERERQCSVDRN